MEEKHNTVLEWMFNWKQQWTLFNAILFHYVFILAENYKQLTIRKIRFFIASFSFKIHFLIHFQPRSLNCLHRCCCQTMIWFHLSHCPFKEHCLWELPSSFYKQVFKNDLLRQIIPSLWNPFYCCCCWLPFWLCSWFLTLPLCTMWSLNDLLMPTSSGWIWLIIPPGITTRSQFLFFSLYLCLRQIATKYAHYQHYVLFENPVQSVLPAQS